MENNSDSVSVSKKTKKRSKTKVKLYPSRVKTGAIEQNEISNLKTRYLSVDSSKVAKFSDFPLSKKTVNGLKDNNYSEPTRVQRESIALSLRGLDVLGAAKTGSGKTLAFVIPVLERLFCEQWTRLDGLGALIITPTRELALQIFETFRKVGSHHDFSAGLIIGGKDYNFEKKLLNQCNIMICTPGRLLQHMDENRLLDCTTLKILVIDEADRCLDMGFKQQMNGILENLPPFRQTLLFSATQTKSVKDLARLSLKDPVYVSVDEHAQYSTPEQLRQSYIVTPIQNKMDVLFSFLKTHKKKKLIVFLTSCNQVRFVFESLSRLRFGLPLMALHGKMHQLKRMGVYEEFCRRQSAILLATDIAARGLDFPAVDWVVQMDCPEDVNSYIHRAGRTARYQRGGESLLVLLPSEEPMIEKLTEKKIPITRIEVNPQKMQTIQRKLEAHLAKDVELKQMAQRAFVTYIKSIFLMSDKSVFDVNVLDLNAYARSLGLAVAPRVRIVQKHQKAKEAKKAPTETSADWRRTDLEQVYKFGDEGAGSDDDILTMKRKDHTLDGEEGGPELTELKKKTKILTKEKVAKRILRKKLTANQKVAFDEEGNRIFDATREKVSDLARNLEMDAVAGSGGGIDIEETRRALREEDKFDKEVYRQKIKARHREERLKAKAERRKNKQPEEQNEEGQEDGDAESDVDDTVAEIIDALPDPDKVYGPRGSDSEGDGSDGDVYKGPPVAKKRQQASDESDDTSDGDDDGDVYTGPPVAKKRLQPSDSEESSSAEEIEETKAKKKWAPKKPLKKKTKKVNPTEFDTGLDLALDEELAIHLLSSKH